MKDRIKSFLNKGKRKHAVAFVGGALALTLGTGAVFAASPSPVKESLLAKIDNGVKVFSTDNGKTWTKNAPADLTQAINKDGSEASTIGVPPKNGKRLMVRNINGVTSYSTDGGKTWSDKAPDGFSASKSPDGSFVVKGKTGSNGKERGQLLVRNQNGDTSYSTDGRKTWKEGTPPGFNEKVNADGTKTSAVGNPPKGGKSLLVQNQNGKVKYSTDGGKTWSDKAPEGFVLPKKEQGK